MTLKKITQFCIFISLFITLLAFADDENFVVKHIRVQGLQRITLQTVLEYLPVHAGQSINQGDTALIIRSLYDTGFFSDVSLARDEDTLIVKVVERATIGAISISGNKQVKKDDLLKSLKQVGISEGEPYSQATLAGVKQALVEQYNQLGRYSAAVTTKVTDQSRNRVGIDIVIEEGKTARVKQIHIVGNHAFSTKKLLKAMQLEKHVWWKFLSKGGDYSAEKLNQDLEALRNFYLNRGYLRFKIDSSDAKMSADNREVYITIQVTEGSVYHIKGYQLSGQLLDQEAAVRKFIVLKPNQVFSRARVMAIDDAINRFYGDQGFAMSNVNVIPTIDDDTKEVFLNFEVNPGRRIYVRHINYSGNVRTSEEVFRRETRQVEGGVYSVSKLEETKRRLNNLGYVEDVNAKIEPVPGTSDEVDVLYSLKETPSTTANAQIGYSDEYGVIYGANIVQKNFQGVGKSLSLGFNNSQYAQVYNLGYFDPYYTDSGISRGFNLFYQKTTPGDANIASYTVDSYGGSVNYRVPMSEYDNLSFAYGYEYLDVSAGNTSTQIQSFLNNNGSSFNNIKLTGGWSHNSYDRIIFPTKGFNQWIGGEIGLPILPKNLDYFRINYDATVYQPIWKGVIASLGTTLGYGNGYANFNELPFFKNFYAGGMGTVRGFEPNTLGPRDSNNNPLGGNVLTVASFNLIIPNPISANHLRTSLFLDAGNVYENQFVLSEVRLSTGLGVVWVSPMGPLKFSIAKALSTKPGDQLKTLDFSVATSF